MVNLFSLDALTIDWQSVLQTAQKENTNRIPFILTFHPHTTTQLDISFLKTWNYF